ncbi:hypothetical protein [Teredinibacter haidensis]|uniref:hypothetical protein n=1 Tax=Teredinibacter haidensis TaxID=2731755 RepID=UPI0009491C40|nr:hypothetical protein [Teredinibacter haidensis]
MNSEKQQDDASRLEQQLKALPQTNKVGLSPQQLADTAERQEKTTEFLRLGAFGLYALLLSFFAPFARTSPRPAAKGTQHDTRH